MLMQRRVVGIQTRSHSIDVQAMRMSTLAQTARAVLIINVFFNQHKHRAPVRRLSDVKKINSV